ncbi:amidohydrolase family protein [Burkholderia anthina]|uniref:amidohydrolase family protein n=1 Tax=Burkholderia anthina TaxID=179879 RepID=UPI0039F6E3D7
MAGCDAVDAVSGCGAAGRAAGVEGNWLSRAVRCRRHRHGAERMLWGTDWPHPTRKTDKPDDASMLDVIAGWIGRADWQQRIFVTNPAKLYGFA